MTPEEAWSGVKPSIEHFRIFGCISHVHVPYAKRTKLDDKSFTCVLLGVSENSKAYRLYDPMAKKIALAGMSFLRKTNIGIGIGIRTVKNKS